MNEYLDVFIEETKENLQYLNTVLLEIEKDKKNMKLVNELFRVAHTLKGMAGAMAFNKMNKLTHEMENILDAVRNNKIELTETLYDNLFECLDALENFLEQIIQSGEEGSLDYSSLIADIKKALDDNLNSKSSSNKESNKNIEAPISESKIKSGTIDLKLENHEIELIKTARSIDLKAYNITVEIDKNCSIKAARAYILVQEIEKHGNIIKSIPCPEDIQNEKFDFEISFVIVSKAIKDDIFSGINSISEITSLTINEIQDLETSNTAINKSSIKETSKSNDNVEKINEALEKNKQESRNIESSNNVDKSDASSKSKDKTLRVDIKSIDEMVNLVTELIMIKSRINEETKTINLPSLTEALEYMENTVTGLHEVSMKIRMLPLDTVFNRFPRMIRDAAKALDKKINLIISGEDTKLDKTVIEQIGDPLIHLLRNSADHGLESTEDRIKAGKEEFGNIYLRAYQDGNDVIIEVEDDGNGINCEKVKNIAIKKNLITKEQAAELSQSETIRLLFLPNFSTADSITAMSGRGVGLDVVASKIESLGGAIEVDTVQGCGSKFLIRLPLTLAILKVLLVEIDNEKYAIPLMFIDEIIKMKKSEIKNIKSRKAIIFRENILPLVDLYEALGIPKENSEEKENGIVIVVSKGNRLMGLEVDRLIGHQDIVVKSLGELLNNNDVISGASILGDGSVVLILDVDDFFSNKK